MIAFLEAQRAGLLGRAHFARNAVAGVVVGIVAMPLAMAFAIASGATPAQGLYTAIVAGLATSLLGGTRVQISGPTGAFIAVLAGITAQYGIAGLQLATLMAGVILLVMGLARLGSVIKFIPNPVITGFTAGIAVVIWVGQWKDFFGLHPAPGGSHFHEKLLALIKDRARIDDMILTLHANDFFLYQRLYALYRLDAVRVDKNAPPDAEKASEAIVGEEQSAEQIAAHAQQFLDAGNPRDAETLARHAYELSPTPENRDLVGRCEKALGARLRENLMAGQRVPSLLVAPAMLKTMQLSAPEKYLLSRIDGKRDIGAIISVSPLRELEALKLFQHFLDGGLVAMR